MAISTALSEAFAGKMPSAPNINMVLEVTLDTSYPTGGYAWDADEEMRKAGGYDKSPGVFAVLGLRTDGYGIEYIDSATPANRKLKLYVPAGTEVPNATDLSVTPGSVRVLLLSQ